MSQILISHRGNINGRIPEKENHPDYIDEAIQLGYDVEIDLWLKDGDLYLGHDEPQYKINKGHLYSDKLWIHCKNIEALEFMIDNIVTFTDHWENPDFFFHDKDDATLTHKGYIWTYPGKILNKSSICVLPEWTSHNINYIKKCSGICSDFIEKYK